MLTPHTVQSLGLSLFPDEPAALDFAIERTRTHCMNESPIIPFGPEKMEYVAVITVPGVLVVAGAWYSTNVCGFRFTPDHTLSSPLIGVVADSEY